MDKGKRVRAVRDKELEHIHDSRRLWEAFLFYFNSEWSLGGFILGLRAFHARSMMGMTYKGRGSYDRR
jgi:hypothetical protein